LSSVYRKGRDGYFYYQTYVYDSKTGKKNKRKFHALNTKDKKIAEKKQKHYDSKYSKKNLEPTTLINNRHKQVYFSILFMFFIYLVFEFENDSSEELILKDEVSMVKVIKNRSVLQSSLIENKIILNNLDQTIELVDSLGFENHSIIPAHIIERVEDLSGAFNQGRIYVTVEKSYNSNDLMLLCEMLKEDYSEFSNIVICIYKNSEFGKILSRGQNINADANEIKDCWLAMYTYNEVEGSYFNDNPGGYLGAF
jgi:hypothetical protein